ncbi:hypothetical protein [Hymenobacter sp. GOD-10R]|uniref:hypothetical protein n=1 Tax=Hymenobacter sp. GOD-10R TaxID=3093922 RepID=UPI002D77C1AE|nr:hypothetical protein [Hymenobacter sp. GOD-10R]WRQ26951.1 hypothetical protein SD425_17910 [Hymenobacter sp. GOD-10R]
MPFSTLMKQYVRWRSFVAAAMLLTACKKDSDLLVVGSRLTEQNTLGTFVAVHGVPKQLFTLTAASDSFQFKTVQGNRLTFPANAFLLPSGMRPNTTPISVEFREITSKSDMVLSAMPTTAGEQLLESAGQFYLKAKQGTTVLHLAPATHLRLSFQNTRLSSGTSNLQLFYGTTIKTLFNWLPQSNTDIVSGVSQDSVPGQPRAYRIRLNNDSLGWVNCGRIITRTPQTTVSISVAGENVQGTNTMVFLVFKALNSVVRAYPQTDNMFAAPNIPQGLQATVVVLRNVNDTYYLGQQTAQVGANHVFSPSMSSVSEAAAVAAIQAL